MANKTSIRKGTYHSVLFMNATNTSRVLACGPFPSVFWAAAPLFRVLGCGSVPVRSALFSERGNPFLHRAWLPVRMSDIQTKTYSKYLRQLTELLQSNPDCCLGLATELVARELIAHGTLDAARAASGIDRALTVLTAVRPTIQGNQDTFKELIQSLQQEPILCSVAANMQREVASVGSGNGEEQEAPSCLGECFVEPSSIFFPTFT